MSTVVCHAFDNRGPPSVRALYSWHCVREFRESLPRLRIQLQGSCPVSLTFDIVQSIVTTVFLKLSGIFFFFLVVVSAES